MFEHPFFSMPLEPEGPEGEISIDVDLGDTGAEGEGEEAGGTPE